MYRRLPEMEMIINSAEACGTAYARTDSKHACMKTVVLALPRLLVFPYRPHFFFEATFITENHFVPSTSLRLPQPYGYTLRLGQTSSLRGPTITIELVESYLRAQMVMTSLETGLFVSFGVLTLMATIAGIHHRGESVVCICYRRLRRRTSRSE